MNQWSGHITNDGVWWLAVLVVLCAIVVVAFSLFEERINEWIERTLDHK